MSVARSLRALVFETEGETQTDLCRCVGERGLECTRVSDFDRLTELVKDARHQVAILDLDAVPGEVAPLLLRSIRSLDETLCVICVTAFPTVPHAIAAMKLGAFDYLKKPIDVEELSLSLQQALLAHGVAVDKVEQLPVLLGEQLRRRRKELGLTLKKVSSRSGLSLSQLSHAERGGGAVTIRTLYKMATALRTSMAQLFEGI